MDPKLHIKVLMDSFIENGTVLMCAIHKERSGSYLIKVRIDDIENGGQVNDLGEATQNNSLYFRRKNKKQIDRDLNRSSKHHQENDTQIPRKEYTLRSTSKMSVEKPRTDLFSDPCDIKQLSPEVPSTSPYTFASPDPNLPHATESSPKPLMRASLESLNSMSEEQLAIEPDINSTTQIYSNDIPQSPTSPIDEKVTNQNESVADPVETKSPSKPTKKVLKWHELEKLLASEIDKTVKLSMSKSFESAFPSTQNPKPPDGPNS